MNFKLEEYLKRPRTFKGPLADYVMKRVKELAEKTDTPV